LFFNVIGIKRTIVFFFGRSIGLPFLLFSRNGRLLLLALLHSCLHELLTRMVPAKNTQTFEWEFSVQHSMILVLDDHVPDFWNLCLFVLLSCTLCYWTGLEFSIMIKSVIPVWSRGPRKYLSVGYTICWLIDCFLFSSTFVDASSVGVPAIALWRSSQC